MKATITSWPPFRSPEVRNICSNLTPVEKQRLMEQAMEYGQMSGQRMGTPCAIITILLIVSYNLRVPIYLIAIAVFVLIMFFVVYTLAFDRRVQAQRQRVREILCDTGYAQAQGYRPETLPLYTFPWSQKNPRIKPRNLNHGLRPGDSSGAEADDLSVQKSKPNRSLNNFQNKEKIIKTSKSIRSYLLFGLLLWTAAILAFLVLFLLPIFNPPAVPPKGHISFDLSQLLYIRGSMIPFASFGFIVNLQLFRFFDRLKDGYFFDAQTIVHLSNAGRWWVAFSILDSFIYVIGDKFFQVTTMSWGAGNVLAGMALIFVAWLLKEAQGLQEEQELTV